MATFTLELRRVIELTGGRTEIAPDGVSRLIGGNTGFEHFHCFDAEYKPVLIGKIVDHFWNREIGRESVDMFQLAARRKMNEIMPYFNQLYESTQLEFDPLSTVKISTINKGIAEQVAEGNSQSITNNTTNAGSRAVNSDTPQMLLRPDGDYATSGADVISQSEGDGTGSESSESSNATTSENESTTSGYQGLSTELIIRYRESFLNIDMDVIASLEELFMSIYGNSDEFNEHYGRIY